MLIHQINETSQYCTETVSDVIHFGNLNFNQATGKEIVSDSLRVEIVEVESTYFQDNTGSFAQKVIDR